jgi:hypothetical protein
VTHFASSNLPMIRISLFLPFNVIKTVNIINLMLLIHVITLEDIDVFYFSNPKFIVSIPLILPS